MAAASDSMAAASDCSFAKCTALAPSGMHWHRDPKKIQVAGLSEKDARPHDARPHGLSSPTCVEIITDNA